MITRIPSPPNVRTGVASVRIPAGLNTRATSNITGIIATTPTPTIHMGALAAISPANTALQATKHARR
jgi:hypothetical protein